MMYVSRKTWSAKVLIRNQEISKAKFLQSWEGDRAADRLDAWRHQCRSSERDVAMSAIGGDMTGLIHLEVLAAIEATPLR